MLNVNKNMNKLVHLNHLIQLNRKSIGSPLEIKLPPESVIPVFASGFPEKHIGYFLVIDPEGYPVSKDKKMNYFNEFGRILSPSNQTHLCHRKVIIEHLHYLMSERV